RYAGGVVSGAAVVQVIPVDRGQYDVTQAHQLNRLGGVLRLFRVQPAFRVAGIHCAEFAGAGTHRTHHHDGGRAVGPAFTDVGAVGFLAHCAQAMFRDVAAHRVIALATGHTRPQPFRLALQGLVFRV